MCVCQCVALAGFAQGVEFRDISFAGALKAAKAENKTVFMDCYTSWCGPCKNMADKVFPQKLCMRQIRYGKRGRCRIEKTL